MFTDNQLVIKFVDNYKEGAEDVIDSAKYAVTVKMDLDHAEKALAANDTDKVKFMQRER